MNFVEIGCNTFWFDNGIKYFVTYILGGLQSPHGCTVGKASKPFFFLPNHFLLSFQHCKCCVTCFFDTSISGRAFMGWRLHYSHTWTSSTLCWIHTWMAMAECSSLWDIYQILILFHMKVAEIFKHLECFSHLFKRRWLMYINILLLTLS